MMFVLLHSPHMQLRAKMKRVCSMEDSTFKAWAVIIFFHSSSLQGWYCRLQQWRQQWWRKHDTKKRPTLLWVFRLFRHFSNCFPIKLYFCSWPFCLITWVWSIILSNSCLGLPKHYVPQPQQHFSKQFFQWLACKLTGKLPLHQLTLPKQHSSMSLFCITLYLKTASMDKPWQLPLSDGCTVWHVVRWRGIEPGYPSKPAGWQVSTKCCVLTSCEQYKHILTLVDPGVTINHKLPLVVKPCNCNAFVFSLEPQWLVVNKYT